MGGFLSIIFSPHFVAWLFKELENVGSAISFEELCKKFPSPEALREEAYSALITTARYFPDKITWTKDDKMEAEENIWRVKKFKSFVKSAVKFIAIRQAMSKEDLEIFVEEIANTFYQNGKYKAAEKHVVKTCLSKFKDGEKCQVVRLECVIVGKLDEGTFITDLILSLKLQLQILYFDNWEELSTFFQKFCESSQVTDNESNFRDWLSKKPKVFNTLSMVLNTAAKGKNWRALGEELGCNVNVLRSFEKKSEPAEEFLIYWCDSKEASLGRLRQALEAIDQHTAIEVLNKYSSAETKKPLVEIKNLKEGLIKLKMENKQCQLQMYEITEKIKTLYSKGKLSDEDYEYLLGNSDKLMLQTDNNNL